MEDKSCQSFSLDWNNIEGKCPCCGQAVKISFNWSPEGVSFSLLPTSSSSSSPNCQNHASIKNPSPEASPPQTKENNSLLNIVSVASNKFLTSPTLSLHHQQQSSHPLQQPAMSHSLHSLTQDSNSHHFNSSENSNNPSADGLDEDDSNEDSSMSASSRNNFHSPLFLSPNHLNSHALHPVMSIASLSPITASLQTSPRKLEALTPASAVALASIGSDFITKSLPKAENLIMIPQQQQQQPQPKFKCEVVGCHQSFVNGQQLDLHYKEHKGEKIQKCDWFNCHRLFSSKEKLRNHIRCRHTGERPFKCDDCDKAFTSPKHLKDHKLLHTDERPFECEWEGCGLKFRRRHHLVAHKRVHTKERPFSCSYPGCEMKFTKSHHVKRHYETHFKYKSTISVPSTSSSSDPSSSSSIGLTMSLPTTSAPLVTS